MIELTGNKIIPLTYLKWSVHFSWVKGQAGTEGNELADRFVKEAAVEAGQVTYDKIPRDVIMTREKENGLHMW
jgi:ribonuclease HI